MISTYTRHSPSALNLFAACREVFILEKILGFKQPGSAKMELGTAVEHGVAIGLKNPKAEVADCIAAAVMAYDTKMALRGDPHREGCRADIPAMVESALTELRPYGIPSATQGFIEWRPEELKLPVVGYFDFEWADHGIIVDLKTTGKMPSAIKLAHARQVAFYTGDNIEGRVTYVTPKKYQTYLLENKREHRASLVRIGQAVERFLSLSDDPQFYIDITAPDYDHFYWNSSALRQAGLDAWGY
jgi:hypothetical protein